MERGGKDEEGGAPRGYEEGVTRTRGLGHARGQLYVHLWGGGTAVSLTSTLPPLTTYLHPAHRANCCLVVAQHRSRHGILVKLLVAVCRHVRRERCWCLLVQGFTFNFPPE